MKVVRHGDQTLVVHLFTRSFGMVPFVVRRTSGRARGMAAAMLQPLAQLSIECTAPAAGRMQVLRQAELNPPYSSIPFSPHKCSIALFLGEFLWNALRAEQPSDPLYEFLSLSLLWLDGADAGYANFHLILLLQLTRYMGYDPTNLPEAETLQIDKLMRHNFRTMRLLPLDGPLRSRYLDRLAAFYRENVPSFPELNALGVLTDMYRE